MLYTAYVRGLSFVLNQQTSEYLPCGCSFCIYIYAIIRHNSYGLVAECNQLILCVADGLFCREIDGLFCRSSPDIIVRRRCVLSHKRRGWLEPSPSFRYSRNLALQDELYHPVINNGPAVLVCVDKRLGTGPVNQSRDAG